MKHINNETPVKLKTLIVSGDLTENSIIEIFDAGNLVALGRWYNDNILDFSDRWGVASKAGTGLTVKFELRQEKTKMKLYQDPNWKAVHFPDETILKSDGYLISNLDWENLIYDVEVEPTNIPGHYKACTPADESC